jgi:small subunit ribosomal protein S4e
MSKKGGKRQIKRLAAPKSMKLLRKEMTWTVKSAPGPHGLESSVPLLMVIRDYLKLAGNAREAKKVIKEGQILVDGRAVYDPKIGLGFMDVLEIPSAKLHYRVVLDKKGRILMHELKSKADFKLCRVQKKTMIKGKKVQVTLHDGRNIVTEKSEYGNGDVLKIAVPKQEVTEKFELKKGNTAYITDGKHAGEIGKIEEVLKGTASRRPIVLIKSKEKEFSTPADYVFVVGKDKPVVDLG